MNNRMRGAFRENRARIADINSQIEDSLSGIRVVKSFGNETEEMRKFNAGNDRFVDSKKVSYRYMGIYNSGMGAFSTLITVISLIVGALLMTGGKLGAADLVTFLLYINNCTDPVKKLVNFTEQFQNGYSGYERFLEIMSIAPDIQDKPDALPLKNVQGEVTFENVSFHYEESKENVLSNVNLHVPAGDYVALVGSSGAGKTTLLEAMLYRGGATRRLGRVDHQDAFLDTDEQERARGITIFSKQAELALPEADITFLDTPGHVDFSAEMERTLQVLDYALLLVSGTDGVQSHTRTLWQLLRRYQIPTIVFVNKMDLPGKGRDGILQELRQELSENCAAFDADEAALHEELSLLDEALMEQVLKTGQLEDAQIAGLIAKRRVFPCFFGAALQLQGVDELLSALQRYTVAPSYPAEFSAQVYKIARGEKDERLTFLKVTGGCLRVKQALRAEDWEEKADQLRLYSGNKYTLLQQARAGMVCAVTGLSRTQAGEHLGAGRPAQAPVLEPVLEYRMHADTDDLQGAYLKLRRLEEEDPQLHLVWDHQLREIRVQLMGPVQMEILQRLIAARFGGRVSVRPSGRWSSAVSLSRFTATVLTLPSYSLAKAKLRFVSRSSR